MFVQPDMVVFQIQGKHAVFQASLAHRMPHLIHRCELEWSSNVTAVGFIGGDMIYGRPSEFYTVSHKKPCHFVFDNNSGVSWSIFILFVLVETGRNTVKYTYLMA